MLADPRSDALVEQFRRAVAAAAQPRREAARRAAVSRLRREPAPGLPARDRALFRQHHPRGSKRSQPADGRLHVRQRTSGQALRHPERQGQPLQARRVHRRPPSRAARSRQRAARDVARHPDLSGASRQVDSDQHPRHAAARSAGQRAAVEGELGLREERAVGARPDGRSSAESSLRRLPFDD